jgi:hypothetical protein
VPVIRVLRACSQARSSRCRLPGQRSTAYSMQATEQQEYLFVFPQWGCRVVVERLGARALVRSGEWEHQMRSHDDAH